MRKNNLTGLLAAVFAWHAGVWAQPTALPAVDIPVTADAQVRVALSNTDPNLLVVPGDRIVAVDSAQGMFINDNRALGQANGGVQLMALQTTPFTFYVRTEGGLTVSAVGIPQKRSGRMLHLVTDRPAHPEVVRRWERAEPYVRMLSALHKALLVGLLPLSFSAAPVVVPSPFSLPAGLRAEPVQMWHGGSLRLYRFSVRNTGTVSQAITEHLFSMAGVRAVMVFPFSVTLMPGARTSVWAIVSDELR